MSNEDSSPFWASPPYILLTDVLQLDKIEPWNVDVGKLVAGFIREMKRLGDIDFRISGSALYSASVIFMKKTRELVELGILPPETADDDEELVIPLIRPPFRVSNQRVTLQELLIAMDRLLSQGSRTRTAPQKKRYRPSTEPMDFKMETTRADVEENITEVYNDLLKIMEIGETAKFVDVLMNNTRREIVRVFFALLHLHGRAFIDIWMDDDEVIWVKMLPLPPPPSEEDEEIQASIETK
jgi:segregation and condensation protein A